MRTLLLTFALTLTVVPAAIAGSPTIAKQVAAPTARSYWLSDGLNRLVFWQPQSSTNARPKDIPDAR